MTHTPRFTAVLALILILSFGCAGKGGGGSPVEPSIDGDPPPLTSAQGESAAGRGRVLLGLWDLAYDPCTGTFSVVPARAAAFHVNVVLHLQKPGSLTVGNIKDHGGGRLDVDVGIRHPFPGSSLCGFDVRGIVIGNMSSKDDPDLLSAKDDPDLLWTGPHGLRLENTDGWTRWWNPKEFKTAGLFGYTQGYLGKPGFFGPATLNPYKCFADALGVTSPVIPSINPTNRGIFAADTSPVTRKYELQFPLLDGGVPDWQFQYAVDASWEPPYPTAKPPYTAEDFPPEANCSEAFYIKADQEGVLSYSPLGVALGNLVLDIEIFDWGAQYNGIVAEIEEIRVQSPNLFDQIEVVDTLTGIGSLGVSGIYHHSFYVPPADVPPDPEVLVTVIAKPITSYKPPSGQSASYPVGKNLAAYTVLEVETADSDPGDVGFYDPPVGELIDVEVRDKACYVLNTVDGFQVINVTDPEDPFWVKEVSLPYTPVEFDVQDGYAYVVDAGGEMQVIDIDPVENAAIVHAVSLGGNPTSVDADGDYAYVGNDSGTLSILDISPPESASVVNTVSTTGATAINDLKAANGYAYVAAADFEVFDVYPPGSASSVKVVPTSTASRAVDLGGSGYAFVADSSSNLLLVDVDPPGSAAIVDTFGLDGNANDIVCNGNLGHLTVSDGSFLLVYFDPGSETAHSIGELDTLTLPTELSVEDNMAYVVDTGELVFIELWYEEDAEGWARTWGLSTEHGVYGDSVAVDSQGNSYIVGRMDDLYPSVCYDIFARKHDPTGGLLWSRTWNWTLCVNHLANGVAVDSFDNVYITGMFFGTQDFDPGSGEESHTADYYDIYLMKLDTSGGFQWARTWSGSGQGNDAGNGVCVDTSDNVYVGGHFRGSGDFDPGPGTDTHTSSGGYDAFLSKFDSSGNFQWARNWGGIGFDVAREVAVDGSDGVYATGWFEGTADFDPGAGSDTRDSNGWMDIYLSKLDTSGSYQWARAWGGPQRDGGEGVAADSSGATCVTGVFEIEADFDPGPGTDQRTGNGGWDAFVSHFNPSGDYQWARTWGGFANDYAYGLALEGSESVYTTGYYASLADFDPGPDTDFHTPNGSFDLFLSKLDLAGDFQWARTWGGTRQDEGREVAVDAWGNARVAGFFGELGATTVDFDPGPDTDYHSTQSEWIDSLLIKVLPNGYWYW